MNIISFLRSIFIVTLLLSSGAYGSSYNEIKIDEIDNRNNATRLIVSVANTRGHFPEVVILVKKKQATGFFLPKYNGKLVKPTRISSNKWRVEFENAGRIEKVYAISCVLADTSSRSGWSIEKDYQSLEYLDFHKHTSIKQSLYVLDDFGWRPTGYTYADLAP